MKKLRTRLCAIFFSALLCSSACSTSRTSNGEKVYFVGTTAFQKKLQKLTLNEDAARLRLVQHYQAKGVSEFSDSRDLAAIVGDSFLFSGARKAGVDLRGYYVDGHTGKVEFREPKRKQRVVYPPIW